MTELPRELRTPCYIVDRGLLRNNLETLKSVQDMTGCKILLAQKAFAMWSVSDLIREYLWGTSASSLNEARLGREEFGGELHFCAPGIRDDEFDELLQLCDHIVFNSFSQWKRYKDKIEDCERKISCGLRINPKHSEVKTTIYDPCAAGSRMGILPELFDNETLEGISGFHFHNLCELNSDALQRTLAAVEEKFFDYLPEIEWINFGGGHHITRPDYDIDLLCDLISDFTRRYDVQVYLEPGEAVALNAGVLAASVLDIVRNEMDIAVLDTSAATHMPDVLEMPYRPEIRGAGKPGEHAYTYRLAGPSCLAGDVIGDYSFKQPLEPGSRIVFGDMAHYTMVKNNTFNGINLPDIVIRSEDGSYKLQRRFGYEDFKNRLS
jgi:carboxynorspermidine decarboxylase